jgi:hypothetical protein
LIFPGCGFFFLLRLQKFGEAKMRPILWVLAASLALVGAASAQDVNLTGRYRCVQGCVAQEGDFASATQHGWDLDLVNEAGVSAKAWIDRAGHIWSDRWREGARYSPDGMTIQFEGGAVWQRYDPATAPPPVQRRPRKAAVR